MLKVAFKPNFLAGRSSYECTRSEQFGKVGGTCVRLGRIPRSASEYRSSQARHAAWNPRSAELWGRKAKQRSRCSVVSLNEPRT